MLGVGDGNPDKAWSRADSKAPGLVLTGTCTLEVSELTLGTLGEEAGDFLYCLDKSLSGNLKLFSSKKDEHRRIEAFELWC